MKHKAMWFMVFLVATYDSYVAYLNRNTMNEWEMNPIARLLTTTISLEGLLCFKFVGIAFALGLSLFCRHKYREQEVVLRVSVTSIYFCLGMYYVTCIMAGLL